MDVETTRLGLEPALGRVFRLALQDAVFLSGLQTFLPSGPYAVRAEENDAVIRTQTNPAQMRAVANNANVRTVQSG